ncbi:MAG: phosphogluconate dehydratase, partial [Methylophilaceae bacterium]
MKHILSEVTERIRERSAPTRYAYLQRIEKRSQRNRGADRMGCANVAHAFAAMPKEDKFKVLVEKSPNIGIVTAYNDMLSAHQPYAAFPDII